MILALLSGVLFTANNFVLKQTGVSVGDVVMVRLVLQVLLYLTIALTRGETVWYSIREKQIYVILQGQIVMRLFLRSLYSVKFAMWLFLPAILVQFTV